MDLLRALGKIPASVSCFINAQVIHETARGYA
jgi:hypothetical protein